MLKALVLKELRETARIALVALAAHLACVANCAGYAVLPFRSMRNVDEIPFLDGSFLTSFCFVSVALAAAQAGCHLFIEKPLSHSLDQLDELANLLEAKSLVCMVAY